MEQNYEQTNQTIEQFANFYSDQNFLEAIAKAEENKAKATAYVGEIKDIPKVEEGQFFAITTEAKYDPHTQTKNGLKACLKVTFSIFVQKGNEPVELVMHYWANSNSMSPYVKQLSVLLGTDIREGFKICDLIGKYCNVNIKHTKSNDGRIFANVEELSLVNLPIKSTNL